MMPGGAAHRRDGKGGFALLELMLALTLIALLAALSLPGMMRATGPAALRVAAFQVAALLRQDRNVAQSTGRTIASRIGDGGTRIFSGAAAASIGLPAGATASLADSATRGVRFFADGTSSGGEIVIASATARCLVAVSRDTGAVLVRPLGPGT